MSIQHTDQANGLWFKHSIAEQLADIGSEIGRMISWKNKGNAQYLEHAFFRSLELLDLTISDAKNISRLKELARLREVVIDYFDGENEYGSTDDLWEQYFLPYNYAARNIDIAK
jgi:hypothetical protein